MNKQDPLFKNPDQGKQLMENFGQVANGFSTEDVINAATSILVNALRQAHSTRQLAEAAYDEYMAKSKGQLMDCYDSFGRKKGIYPYHQTISVPGIDFRKSKK